MNMDVLGTILLIVFVSLLIGVAAMFGVTILIFVFTVTFITGCIFFLHGLIRRWWFVRNANRVDVIEVEYKDISNE